MAKMVWGSVKGPGKERYHARKGSREKEGPFIPWKKEMRGKKRCPIRKPLFCRRKEEEKL